jgi:hypothetical protein
MSFVRVKLIEEAFMPTDKTEIVTTPCGQISKTFLPLSGRLAGWPCRPTRSVYLLQANKKHRRKHEHHHKYTGSQRTEATTKRYVDGRRLQSLLAPYRAGLPIARLLRWVNRTRRNGELTWKNCGLRTIGEGELTVVLSEYLEVIAVKA